MLKQTFLMFAAYNAWANTRIYDAAAELTDEEYGRDLGLFFRSINGTLNHLLVTDRIWMKRLTSQGEAPLALDAIIHPNLAPLRIARESEDARIRDWIASLSERELAGRFTYTTISDMRTVSQRLAPVLFHLFNHQTHHRGQIHAALTGLGRDGPVLDLVAFHRTEDGHEFA